MSTKVEELLNSIFAKLSAEPKDEEIKDEEVLEAAEAEAIVEEVEAEAEKKEEVVEEPKEELSEQKPEYITKEELSEVVEGIVGALKKELASQKEELSSQIEKLGNEPVAEPIEEKVELGQEAKFQFSGAKSENPVLANVYKFINSK